MFFTTSEHCHIDRREPGDFSGRLLELSDGVTHYEMAGNPEGPVVVLIHGYSVPFYIWTPTFDFLAANGFCVIRYDLFGRGGSDRPHLDYELALYERQLCELLDELVPGKRVNLLAVCLGGIIAAHFAGRHPERVERLGFVAPAGFITEYPLHTWLLRMPVWGDYLMQLYGDRELLRSLPNHLHRPDAFPEYAEQYHVGLKYAGLKRALVSTARHVPFENAVHVYRELAHRECLLLWGEEDKVLPFELHEQALAAMPKTRMHAISEAGHAAHYERPDVVNPLLLEFFAA